MNPEIEPNNNKQFQKMFDLTKQIEELIEPYRANQSEVFDFEILKNVLNGYQAAYFPSAKLQLTPKLMQHSPNELKSALT